MVGFQYLVKGPNLTYTRDAWKAEEIKPKEEAKEEYVKRLIAVITSHLVEEETDVL